MPQPAILARLAVLILLAPSCAGAAEPGPPRGDLKGEALAIFAAALNDPGCQATFKAITGEDPRAVYAAKRMDLQWEGDPTRAELMQAYGVTACYGKPLVTLFLPRLELAGPRKAANSLLHELLHVAMCTSQARTLITATQEEMAAQAVSSICIPALAVQFLPEPEGD